jgi:GxxExxY protein
MEELNKITGAILDCSFRVHTELGPGLLESTYEACLEYELSEMKLDVQRQLELSVNYKNIKIDEGYRIDLLVENQVIVELKSVESLQKIHKAQLITYLKLSGKKLGLLINFNQVTLKNGIQRVIL